MARLIFTGALDEQVKQHPWLRKLLFRLEYFIVLGFWWSFRALSPERAARLGGFAVGALGPRSPKAATVQANLRIIFPELDAPAIDDLARRTWRSIGMVFGEYPHLDRIGTIDDQTRLEFVDLCGLDGYRRRERPALFFGAHLSNWEIMARALAVQGVPLLVMYAPLQNPHLGKMMDHARAKSGCKWLARASTMMARGASMRTLVKHLGDGGSLGLLLDLSMKEGTPVPFFGHDMLMSLTPARIIGRYGCDLVPMRTQRLGPARFRVTAYPPIVIEHGDGDDEARAIAVTRQLNALMETWIRDQPGEWLCTNRRWHKSLYPAPLK